MLTDIFPPLFYTIFSFLGVAIFPSVFLGICSCCFLFYLSFLFFFLLVTIICFSISIFLRLAAIALSCNFENAIFVCFTFSFVFFHFVPETISGNSYFAPYLFQEVLQSFFPISSSCVWFFFSFHYYMFSFPARGTKSCHIIISSCFLISFSIFFFRVYNPFHVSGSV